MFSGIEVRPLTLLLLLLELGDQFLLLFLSQLFAVNPLELVIDVLEALRILLLFLLFDQGVGFLQCWWGHLLVVFGLSEVHLDVGVNAADLVVGLCFYYINSIFSPSVLNVDSVTFVEDRVMRKFLLQDSLGVA